MEKHNGENIEISLYDGQVKGIWYPKIHSFRVNGKPVKSVTGIIGIKDKSAALVSWATGLARDYLLEKLPNITDIDILEAAGLHTKKKDEAATIGNQIHDWIEGYIKFKLGRDGYKKPPVMPKERSILIGVNAFLDFEGEHKVEFVDSECLTYSREHNYFGWLDIDAVVDGARSMVDIKTGNDIYNSVMLQTAAYAKSRSEELGIEYSTRWAVNLAKETEEEYHIRMAKKGKIVYEPYQVLKAVNLDNLFEDHSVDDDFEAFIAAKKLTEWNDRTDFYKNLKK